MCKPVVLVGVLFFAFIVVYTVGIPGTVVVCATFHNYADLWAITVFLVSTNTVIVILLLIVVLILISNM